MDDSIFVDLVNALASYEREDKDKEHQKKGKDSSKENAKNDEKDKKQNKSQMNDTLNTLFPSMQIFNVSLLIKFINNIVLLGVIYSEY